MAPPGRRKHSITLLLVFAAFLLFTSAASAASAVLGIDLGTEYIKTAIAKPGSPIDIVLTKDSKRKEAATLAFKPSRAQANDPEAFPERLYGGDALALSARYPGDVYSNLKSLLGVSFEADAVTQYLGRHPAMSIESIKRPGSGTTQSTVGFKSPNLGTKRDALMVEELLAMEFKNIKANAEASVAKGTFVNDAVITYPAFYTAEEKRAIELAAELAGLRVVGLVSDGLAVGLNYATSRSFDSVTDGAKPEYHLVYDMGAGSTTATVLKFQSRTIKSPAKRNQTVQEVIVMGTGYDKTLGGDALNDIILADMVNDFVEQPKVKKFGVDEQQLRKHGKSIARLWKDAQRVRQILSANQVASASFEGLYNDDINVKYSLTRDRFEELAQNVAGRVEAPLVQALEGAGIGLGELDSVILHGGAVRTPFVQKHLEKAVGGSGKIKANVNADEAAALGAAFNAAAVSASFRVKDLRGTDISGSTITMKWTIDGKDKQQKLFIPQSQIGLEKAAPINTLDDVKFTFYQGMETQHAILEVETANLTKSANALKDKHGCTPANITTTFNIRLSPIDGLPEITAGSVSCQTEGGKEGSVLDNVKGLFGFGGKKEDQQQTLAEQTESSVDPTAMTPKPVSDPTSSGTTVSGVSFSETGSPTNSESLTASSSTTKPVKATPSTVTIPVALKARALGLNAPPSSALPRIRQRLSDFDASDRRAVLRAEALNTLESFTYRARDYLEDMSFIAVSSDKARKELSSKLAATSDWLYGDGSDAKLQDFKDRLKGLQKLVEPVLKRKDENSRREGAVKSLREGLDSLDSVIKMVEGSIIRAAEESASKASLSTASPSSETSSSSTTIVQGDELDEDPYSAVSAPEASETEFETPKPYEYTQEDLSSVMGTYEAAKKWLDEKLALQEQLGPYEDPAVLVADLEDKSKELQSIVSDTIMKSIKMQELPKRPKSSKKSKTKTKKASKTGKSDSASMTSATSTAASSSTSSSIKDEL